MIAETGHFALILALVMSVAQAYLGLAGAHAADPRRMQAAQAATHAQSLMLALAFAALTAAYVRSDFSVLNVAENSHSLKPLLYKVTGVWGNHEGSMLLWVLVLGAFGSLVAAFGRNLAETLQARVLGVQGLIGVAFLAFIVATSNPFTRLFPPPVDGQDLNPLLQDPGLAFHPPLLYFGYVGLSVTFAFACAALLEGRVDAAWARWVRPWTLLSWITLTLGIALGSWWAYYELGWGGFWFWDPVENASLMPWLAATALLHSAIVVERREALKSWTILLAIIAFAFSLLGTFLVRSGVLTSVHAFANDPERGIFILGIFALAVGGSFALYAWRAPALRSQAVFSPQSREAMLLVNNVLLSAAAAAVLIGTLYPMALDTLTGTKISVGPPYFNMMAAALMSPLMLLMPVGLRAAWKRADLARALKDLWIAAAIAAACTAIVAAFVDGGPILALFGVALGAWLIAGSAADILARVAAGRAPLLQRLGGLPRGVYGAALAHGGMGVLVLGVVAVLSWQQEVVVAMKPGDHAQIAGYDVRFDGVSEVQGPNYTAERATLNLTQGGSDAGALYPERRVYPVTGMPTTEAAIRTSVLGDLYAAIGEKDANGAYAVRIYRNPLAPWIWLGAALMALGGALSLSDRRYRIAAMGLKRKAVSAPA